MAADHKDHSDVGQALTSGGPERELNQTSMSIAESSRLANELKANIAKAVFGQESLITEALCALLAGGHILMTGAPGLAKTTLVRVFSHHLGLKFGRVQFTPDLLPSDIIGSEVLNLDPQSGKRSFEFARGPVFVNLLLANKINRTSPRTQSALLEAMQERAVTVGGIQHLLPPPFMVFATQNPFESEGTFPLPEAQMDRFLLHTLVDYPDAQAEEKILNEHAVSSLVGEQLNERAQGRDMGVISSDHIRALIQRAKEVRVDQEILAAITQLVRSSRPGDVSCPENLSRAIWYGAGPRAGISLISVARALALLEGSESVRWQHVRRLVKPVLRHRIRLTAQAMRDRLTEDSIVDALVERVEIHHANLAKGLA